jgi:hypothetical protein
MCALYPKYKCAAQLQYQPLFTLNIFEISEGLPRSYACSSVSALVSTVELQSAY